MDRSRRRVLKSADEVPVALVDEVIAEMATRLDGSPESRRCAGLSFAFEIEDRPVRIARYDVGERGGVTLTRSGAGAATFHFRGGSVIFDEVLRGRSSALGAIMGRHIHMHGSLWHIRGLLRMMPAVSRAYESAREDMMRRHAHRYEFRF